ncbi:helix-turn-helix transcriptional regulator [Chlorobium sp. N1]|uniref:helix-turn-helix domain-containing protein n=1 Tax=Chlorobium sp. N1 TaxID=2491138 RepID=UPI00103888B4|nr:helix-turn-helix transcriptional regulator [Chlorobium sp. N1]TCD47991.1 XRE family transcriptional regulator [Chlorobium sp. N1]
MDDLTYQPVPHDHDAFLRKAMKSSQFKEGYEALEAKYALIRELLSARRQSGMTQEAVAMKIGTTKSAISRMESGGKHTPSITTLRKYAEAVGCDLVIKLKPRRSAAGS